MIVTSFNAHNLWGSAIISIDSKTDWDSGIGIQIDGLSLSGSAKLWSTSFLSSDEFSSNYVLPIWNQMNSPIGSGTFTIPGKIGMAPFLNNVPGIKGLVSNTLPAPTEATIEAGINLIFPSTFGGIHISDGFAYVAVYSVGTTWFSESNGLGAVSAPIAFGGIGQARIVKTGSTVATYCRGSSTDPWIPIANYSIAFTNMRAGIGSINGYGSANYSYYDYFRVTPFASEGSWASPAYDFGGIPTTQGTISWGQDLPGGTSVKIQTSTSPDQSSWSNWSLPYLDSYGSTIISPPNKYLRILATLNSDSTRQFSPTINNISINYPDAIPSVPTISSGSHPEGKWSSEQTMELQWQMPPGNTAPESGYTYWLYLNGASAPVATASFVLLTATVGQLHSSTIPLLAEGSYQLNLTVTADAFSGGQTATAVPYYFKHDRTAPGPTSISSPTHPELLFANNRLPVFILNAQDSVSGVSGYAAVLDKLGTGDPGLAITHFGAVPETKFSVQDNGTYYLHARAIDFAGNTGPVSHYGIRVDFSGALISEAYVKALPNPVRTNTAKLEYELAAPATEVILEFTSGNGDIVRSAEGGRTVGRNVQVWDVGDLPNGTYFFRVKAKSAEDGKAYLVNKKVALLR